MSGTDILLSVMPCRGLMPSKSTIRSGSGNCSGRNNTEFTTVNIAVVAPIPSASVETAITRNPGRLRKLRTPYWRSLISVSICVNPWLNLFVPKRDQRLHFRCSPRGDVARDQRHADQQQRHKTKRKRIGRTHSVKHTRDRACREVRAKQTKRGADD